MKIGFVSLGCVKNQVNTEQMIWLVKNAGFEVTAGVEDTDAVIINTCGFIESAKEEAINYIIELGQLKSEGKIGRLIVTGCLAQRYPEEIREQLPEVDAIVGTGSYDDIVSVLYAALDGEKPTALGDISAPVSETGRIITTPEYYAYLRIAEGCDNYCSYCVIPQLRGHYRSRPMDKVIEEARMLADSGVKELIVVAQDITRYGTDLEGRPMLAQLLRELCRIEGFEWIRLHYMYPDMFNDELIEVIASEDKIVKYLDIPIQHINDRILKAMRRRGTGGDIRRLFAELRERIPGVVIRTSLIAGLPGEGEEEFEELCEFLREAKIERAGVFAFSPEEGTPAAEMPDQVDEETKEHRVELIVDIQSRIMDEYNDARIDSVMRVLCEEYDGFAECYFGRSFADSPDIDGKVFIRAPKGSLVPGEFVDVLITDTIDGDLIGEIANDYSE